MQGYDFLGLKSAGSQLRRVDEIWNECYGANEEDIYAGVNNRFTDWNPYMEAMGFKNTGARS